MIMEPPPQAAMDPVYKAVRDLEPEDQQLILMVIDLLPALKFSTNTIEIRQVKREGWRIWRCIRDDVAKMKRR